MIKRRIFKKRSAEPIREMEMNPRPPLVAANRIAAYANPDGIRLRFLNGAVLGSTYLHPDETVLEISNLADVLMSPAVAKRLLIDLSASVEQYEERMGVAPTLEEMQLMWMKSKADPQ